MNKYLIALVVFVLGVVVGRSTLPNLNPESNTAATTTGSRTAIYPTTTTTTTTTNPQADVYVPPTDEYYPSSNTGTTTNTTNQQSDEYVYPTDNYYPPTGTTTVPVVNPINNPSINKPSPYVEINSLTSNMSRGNIYNNRTQVIDLQKFLIISGFLNGTADGIFGPMTQQAVIKYQQQNKIYPSVGFVGPLTRNHINSVINDPYDISGNRENAGQNCPCTNYAGTPGKWVGDSQTTCQATNKCEMGL